MMNIVNKYQVRTMPEFRPPNQAWLKPKAVKLSTNISRKATGTFKDAGYRAGK
jgi:hypothetical protein